jgi:hypothetical protein
VDGDQAETIYWIRDEEGGTIGIDVAKSETMTIEMKNESVSVIKSMKNISETMYPEDDLNESSRYLQGFKWHEEARPRDKDDIFRRIEAEMPQAVPETKPEGEPEVKTEEASAEAETQEGQSQPQRHRPRKDNTNN